MAGASDVLHVAAREGNLQAVREILSTNAEALNSRDRHSRTPLHLAAWAGQTDLVKMLCEANADVGASALDDMAAIHFACQKGHFEVVRILLASGAYVNARTRKGMTPLHFAVQGSREDLTKLLIRKGANLSTENKTGKKPVDLARDDSFRVVIRDAELERDARRAKSVKEKPPAGTREEAAFAERLGEEQEEPRPITVPERPVAPGEEPHAAGQAEEAEKARPITVPERPLPQGEDAQVGRQAEEIEGARPITVPERPVTMQEREQCEADEGKSHSLGMEITQVGIVSNPQGEESIEPRRKKPRVALSHLSFDVGTEEDCS